jgi:isoamylase
MIFHNHWLMSSCKESPTMTLPLTSKPLPFGPRRVGDTLEFRLFSPSVTPPFLLLFNPKQDQPREKVPCQSEGPKIWVAKIPLPDPETEYLFEIDGKTVLDPYAQALSVPNTWGQGVGKQLRGQLTFDHTFDWEDSNHPNHQKEDLVIYEMHLRGFTNDPSSKVKHPGTYLGMIEKIPYLKKLGVNAVELLPIFEFDETENHFKNPTSAERLYNYWGYFTYNFFTPMKRYSSTDQRLAPMTELKTLVRELHKNGIEVILDVVYNHVSPHAQFEALDKSSYFILSNGSHTNFSGCGNTINANNPVTAQLILSSLEHFVREYQIDGYRFDLGGCLIRGSDGVPLKNPPVYKNIENSATLSSTKFIAEPWDCGGIYVLGHFPSHRFSEWNSAFKANVRQFIRGSYSDTRGFRDAFLGSHEIFKKKKDPRCSINYITAHDGFSLHDLVSFNGKHNDQNGEGNRDGENENYSQNYGVEGETQDQRIIEIRKKQMKNFHLANLLSIGIPMMLMGDEYGLTHYGNNNTYCHDGTLNWFNWDEAEKNPQLTFFVEKVLQLRHKEPLFRRKQYFHHKEIKELCTHHSVYAVILEDKYVVAFNGGDCSYHLPQINMNQWHVLIATDAIQQENYLVIPPKSSLIACRT